MCTAIHYTITCLHLRDILLLLLYFRLPFEHPLFTFFEDSLVGELWNHEQVIMDYDGGGVGNFVWSWVGSRGVGPSSMLK